MPDVYTWKKMQKATYTGTKQKFSLGNSVFY